MRLLEFLPLISDQISEDLSLACVIAMRDWFDYKVNDYAYFIAWKVDRFNPTCYVSDFEGDMISIAKKHANSQFFKLKVVDGKVSVTEL